MMSLSHEDLIRRAEKWLRGTMRCGVVLCEVIGSSWEQPDAIGWKRGGTHSVLVECKVSRADFLKDKKNWHRRHREHSMGQERWYLTPPGLLFPDELPDGWGLAEVHGMRVRKIKKTPKITSYDSEIIRNEIGLLFSALRKVELGLPLDRLHEEASRGA